MKKVLFVLMALAGTVVAHAYDYPYLTFQNADGTARSVSVESLTMTFVDGQLVVQNADKENVTLTLADLSKMYFSKTTTGISEIQLPVSGNSIEVYSLSGIRIGSFDSEEQVRSTLERGVYIIKVEGETKKIAIR